MWHYVVRDWTIDMTVWTAQDGTTYAKWKELTDGHLVNLERFLKRNLDQLDLEIELFSGLYEEPPYIPNGYYQWK